MVESRYLARVRRNGGGEAGAQGALGAGGGTPERKARWMSAAGLPGWVATTGMIRSTAVVM
jgi:hypothetical protein